MKIRELNKLFGDHGYTVTNCDEYLAIGSSLCHDLIAVDVKTLKIKLALDTWNKGRESLRNSPPALLAIYDKIVELIKNNSIREFFEGDDAIENPITVYTYRDEILVETVTDKIGWPNITKEGWLMYNNTFFTDKNKAINYALKEEQAYLEMLREQRKDLTNEIRKKSERISKRLRNIEVLESLKKGNEIYLEKRGGSSRLN